MQTTLFDRPNQSEPSGNDQIFLPNGLLVSSYTGQSGESELQPSEVKCERLGQLIDFE